MTTSPLRRDQLPKWADASSRTLLDAVPDAILVVNQAGEIVVANVQAEKLFGLDREELIGRSVESLIPPRLRSEHPRHRGNFFATPCVRPMGMGLELFALRGDGTEVPVEISLSPLITESDSFVISAIRDVTDRRRTEELQASEERSRRLVQSSSVAMIVSRGLEERVELMNNKFTALFGYTVDDVPDVAHWWPLAYPDEGYRQAVRTEWQARVEKAIKNVTEIEPMETTVRCKDGSTRHIEAHLSCMGDTNLVTFIDLTERKRAEDALCESEARERTRVKELETILDALPVPVLIAHDADCRRITGNRAACEQLRVAEGRNFSLGAAPDERPAFRHIKDGVEMPADLLPIQQAVATGKPVYGRPMTMVFEDGSIREEVVNVVPLLDDEGKPRGAVAASIDLTEQKKAEQALRESEDKLRLLLDSTAEAIYGIDLEHRCTFCNSACLRALGYERIDEVLGKNMHNLMHHTRADGASYPVEECRVHRVTRTGEGVHAEDEVLWRANGTCFPAEYWSYPQRRGRDVVGAVVAFNDITERKRHEAILRESEERLRVAAQIGRMYAWEWDPATDSVLRSAECTDILGSSDAAGEGIAKDYLNFIHPDDRAELWSLVDALTPENPVYRTQYRRSRPDDALLWLEENGRATFDVDGKMVRLVGMTADITERKRAESALKESEDRYRDLVEHSRDLMCTHDLKGRLLSVNPAVARALGYEMGELLQMSISDLLAPRDRPLFDAFAAQIRRDGVSSGSMRVITRAGEERIWEYHNTLRTEDVPEPIVRGMARDVTDHKRAQKALHQKDMELTEAQRSVSRRLIEAQEQERTRIARDLHDDFGQRLALLTIELELLQQKSPDLPAEVRNRIGELGKQTSEIATDIQSLSHELHSSRLEYVGVAAAMRGFCQEFGDQQKVEIDLKTQDLPSPLSPNISLGLFRVLQEALHNAAKHSGVRHFKVRLWGTSDEIHLTVSDSGAGFDREAAKQSRGLGLISMDERLKLLDGTFSIESEPNRGTTIHARVPLAQESKVIQATVERLPIQRG